MARDAGGKGQPEDGNYTSNGDVRTEQVVHVGGDVLHRRVEQGE